MYIILYISLAITILLGATYLTIGYIEGSPYHIGLGLIWTLVTIFLVTITPSPFAPSKSKLYCLTINDNQYTVTNFIHTENYIRWWDNEGNNYKPDSSGLTVSATNGKCEEGNNGQ